MAEVTQCKSCPWRVGCEPADDIPGYSEELHRKLTCTIAGDPIASLFKRTAVMACHYSKEGEEIPCAGWLENQIGAGNNIGMRLAVMRGHLPVPRTDGPQHETFEDTLP